MRASPITIAELVQSGLINHNELIIMNHREYSPTEATIRRDGAIILSSGRVCRTPTEAAKHGAGLRSVDGWIRWRVPRLGFTRLADLRRELAARE